MVEINGYSTIGMSHGQAIEIIQRGGNTMRLIVRRRSSRVKPLAHQHHLSNGLACVTDSRIVTDKQMHRRSFNKHDSSSNWFQRSVAEKNHSSPSNSHNNNNTNSNAHHQSPKKSDFLRWTMRK
ncbi:unnamed protein product [Trichobilharzia regenti]|nr:unnamed protein product [Trichobilharzia regenti]